MLDNIYWVFHLYQTRIEFILCFLKEASRELSGTCLILSVVSKVYFCLVCQGLWLHFPDEQSYGWPDSGFCGPLARIQCHSLQTTIWEGNIRSIHKDTHVPNLIEIMCILLAQLLICPFCRRGTYLKTHVFLLKTKLLLGISLERTT